MKIHDVLRIGELFVAKGWSTETDGDEQFPLLFDKFCRMSARLDEVERKLVIQLSYDYVRVPPRDNAKALATSWAKLIQSLPSTIKTIVLAPLPKPKGKKRSETNQIKSSDALFYDARGIEARLRRGITTDLVFCANADDFIDAQTASEPTALVLIDDYVGSGNTASTAIAHLQSKALRSNTHIFILALVAQTDAVARVQASNAQLIAGRLVERAISNNTAIVNKIAALATMHEIGRRLRFKKADALGYEGTEAVITMRRTPNNTFPVFWTDRKIDGQVWDSPFTRFTKSVF